jgi:hypothetical protein
MQQSGLNLCPQRGQKPTFFRQYGHDACPRKPKIGARIYDTLCFGLTTRMWSSRNRFGVTSAGIVGLRLARNSTASVTGDEDTTRDCETEQPLRDHRVPMSLVRVAVKFMSLN